MSSDNSDFYRFPAQSGEGLMNWGDEIPRLVKGAHRVDEALTSMIRSGNGTPDGEPTEESRWIVGDALMNVIRLTELTIRTEFSDDEVRELIRRANN